jgi:hypothetical protein
LAVQEGEMVALVLGHHLRPEQITHSAKLNLERKEEELLAPLTWQQWLLVEPVEEVEHGRTELALLVAMVVVL